jgi:hypothetical protein
MMRGPLNLRIEFSGAHSKQRCKLKYETVPIRIVILSQYTLKLLEAETWADRTDCNTLGPAPSTRILRRPRHSVTRLTSLRLISPSAKWRLPILGKASTLL